MSRAALQNGAPLADMEPGGLKLAVAGDAVLGPHLSRRVAGGARPKRKRSAQDQEAVRGDKNTRRPYYNGDESLCTSGSICEKMAATTGGGPSGVSGFDWPRLLLLPPRSARRSRGAGRFSEPSVIRAVRR